MNTINGHSFFPLGYTHEELVSLLDKIANGNILTKMQYDQLINQIGLDNISTFDGNYYSLRNLPDLEEEIKDEILSLNLPTHEAIGDSIEALKQEIDKTINSLARQKSDVNHIHDDRYYTKDDVNKLLEDIDTGDFNLDNYVELSYLTHLLTNYVTLENLYTQLENYATKEHKHNIENIDSLQEELNKKANANTVYSKEDVDNLFANAGDKNHIHESYLTKEEAAKSYYSIDDAEAILGLIESLEESIQENNLSQINSLEKAKSELNEKINLTTETLNASIENSIFELDTRLQEAINDKADVNHIHDNVYTKAEVDQKLIDLGTGGSINLDGYAKIEDLAELEEQISNKADINHNHNFAIEDIEGLQEALDNKSDKDNIVVDIPDNILELIDQKADANHNHDDAYAPLDHDHNYILPDHNHDDIYSPIIHEHDIDEVKGLQEELNNKANVNDILTETDIIEIIENNTDIKIDVDHNHDNLYASIDHDHDEDYSSINHTHNDYAEKEHNHDISNINKLGDLLNSKAEASMVYTKEEIDKKIVDISSGGLIDLEGFVKQSDLASGLATKADIDHNHIISEVDGLQEILDNKADSKNVAYKNELEEGLGAKADTTHRHDDLYSELNHSHEEFYSKEEVDNLINEKLEDNSAEILAEANAHTDTIIANLTQGAPEGMDTFAEIASVIETQNVSIEEYKEEVNTALAGKADGTHIHTEYATVQQEEEREIFTTTELTVSTLGGIQAGSNLNGLTVKEILNKLLYPYVAPTIAITGTPNGGIFEKGNNQTITSARVVVTKKSEKITKIEVLQGSTVLVTQEDAAIVNGGTFTYNVNVPVNSVNVQLTGRVTDASGSIRQSTTTAFTFVYPYYVGVCDENAEINEDLIKGLTKRIENKGTKAISYTTKMQRMILAYPRSYGTIKKILDANSFDVTSTFTCIEMKLTCLDGSTQNYYVYINGASSVEDFTMTFSY